VRADSGCWVGRRRELRACYYCVGPQAAGPRSSGCARVVPWARRGEGHYGTASALDYLVMMVSEGEGGCRLRNYFCFGVFGTTGEAAVMNDGEIVVVIFWGL
jgi:hypothetical protein